MIRTSHQTAPLQQYFECIAARRYPTQKTIDNLRLNPNIFHPVLVPLPENPLSTHTLELTLSPRHPLSSFQTLAHAR